MLLVFVLLLTVLILIFGFAGSYSGLGLCYVRCYGDAHSDGGPSLKDLSNQSSSTIYL